MLRSNVKIDIKQPQIPNAYNFTNISPFKIDDQLFLPMNF